MGLLIITIILFAIVITVLSIGITSRKLPKASVLIAFVVPMILLFGMFTKVNANEVGIIYDDRYGVIEEVKTEGFQMKSIFEHISNKSCANDFDDNNFPITLKTGHGLGMESLKSFTKKYKASVVFTHQEGLFQVCLCFINKF